MNPLETVRFMLEQGAGKASVVDPTEPHPVDPVALEIMRAEDMANVTLRLTGLRRETRQMIDEEFAPGPLLTTEARGALETVRDGLRSAYDEAFTRVSRIFNQARQNGSVVLESEDIKALLVSVGYRNYSLSNFFGYRAARRIPVTELTRLIRDEALEPHGILRRVGDVHAAFQMVRLVKSGSVNAPSTSAFPGVFPDARGLRPEERDDESIDATDVPFIVGATASAGANADADDQGEQRDNPNQ
jgi:hypothetical protein